MPTTRVAEEPSTTRQRASRFALPATGVISGVSAAGAAYAGVPWWVFLCSLLCTAIVSVPAALLPQESEDRRAVWEYFFRHRERMFDQRREQSWRQAQGRAE
ncbi:hypothetical protein [Streptomyces sp. NPDC057545]|uniref:hypothetical protein n=1 Tax=Streptomyces sp. NPDC057545 TaxID=3346164 RepID=UPI00368C71C3